MMSKPTVFISYSHKDKDWKDRFVPHLMSLQMQAQLEIWDDRHINAGEDWRKEIQLAMDAASISVLLVSANFLASNFIQNEEIPRLKERWQKDGMRIVPVIVTPCDWKSNTWLASLQACLKDGQSLSGGNEHQIEENLTEIAKEIRQLLRTVGQRIYPREWLPLPPEHISISRLPFSGEHFFGRDQELEQLDKAWVNTDTNVLSLVAWGGVGKTTLLNHWLDKLAPGHYRGAQRVFAWSFYEHATREAAGSADLFIDAALRWFCDPNPTKGSPWIKGERLARLVRSERTLLILDGLEPLQQPPGPEQGKLKDPALAVLVRELAASNPGLVVITTRKRVLDLDHCHHTASVVELESLSDAAGAELLRALKVQGSDMALQQVSREFGGHGLALNLLGNYLRDVCKGDVRRWNEVSLLKEDTEQGGHAMRVIASYETWLGKEELALMRLLGLYDRPAESQSLIALRTEPVIEGLTEVLFNWEQKTGSFGFRGKQKAIPLSDVQWQRVLARLRRTGLVAKAGVGDSDTLDAHPLVREYFRAQLLDKFPEAWREGNKRLYKYFEGIAEKVYPDTLKEMAPLYVAVDHGCKAGRYKEALENIFLNRIRRGNVAYSWKNLGAFGEDLAACSCFFDHAWSQPVTSLPMMHRGFLLNEAGFCLRALGRLSESIKPTEAALEFAVSLKDSREASIRAANLGELHMALGNLSQACGYAENSVKYADDAKEDVQRAASYSVLAVVLYQEGKLKEAGDWFQKTSNIPVFISGLGLFFFCEFLRESGRIREALDLANKSLEIVEQFKLGPFAEAFGHLSKGRNIIHLDGTSGINNLPEAKDHFDQAVDLLRQAGIQDFLPYALLERAALHSELALFDQAQYDLKEAMFIAVDGSMRIHQADAYLEIARLNVERGENDKALGNLTIAKKMINETGYHRRDANVVKFSNYLRNVREKEEIGSKKK